MKFTQKDKDEALLQLSKEWNQFRPPVEIDAMITDLYWEEKKEHDIILAIIYEFDTLECYARKCYWFSTANSHIREREEALGAFYNSGACKPNCVPKRFRQPGQESMS